MAKEGPINIDGSFLNHLRFADDIVLPSTDIRELNTMLNQLNEQYKRIGLKMNPNKTKIMSNNEYDITIENVDHYIYISGS